MKFMAANTQRYESPEKAQIAPCDNRAFFKAPQVNDTAELVAWLRGQGWSDFAQSLVESFEKWGRLTERQMEAARSMRAKAIAREAARATALADRAQRPAPRAAKPSPGLYSVSGTVYKVQQNRTKTSTYAKVLLDSGEWNYVGQQPFGLLTPAARLTVEAAQAYGRRTGRCAVCARTLTNPTSIEAGIGPVCATRF
jgi:hypothetical protein